MNSRPHAIAFVALAALLLAPDLFALQPICVNSPENPTVVLGLIGAAAAGYPLVRERARGLIKRLRGAGAPEREQRP